MKVFASDIDGCLADTTAAITDRLKKALDIKIIPFPQEDEWHLMFDLDKDECRKLKVKHCYQDPSFWMDAKPIKKNIDELQKWVFEGWVPSLVTGRHTDCRLVTELWLSQNNVPYSNLLFNALDKKARLLGHIDASFMVEDREEEAMYIADSGLTCYLLKTNYNVSWIDKHKGKLESGTIGKGNIIVVDDYTQITEREFNGKVR